MSRTAVLLDLDELTFLVELLDEHNSRMENVLQARVFEDSSEHLLFVNSLMGSLILRVRLDEAQEEFE